MTDPLDAAPTWHDLQRNIIVLRHGLEHAVKGPRYEDPPKCMGLLLPASSRSAMYVVGMLAFFNIWDMKGLPA